MASSNDSDTTSPREQPAFPDPARYDAEAEQRRQPRTHDQQPPESWSAWIARMIRKWRYGTLEKDSPLLQDDHHYSPPNIEPFLRDDQLPQGRDEEERATFARIQKGGTFSTVARDMLEKFWRSC